MFRSPRINLPSWPGSCPRADRPFGAGCAARSGRRSALIASNIAPSERDRQIIRLLVASGQVGRPFIASALVPSNRIRVLRDAFNATVRDLQFIAEAQK